MTHRTIEAYRETLLGTPRSSRCSPSATISRSVISKVNVPARPAVLPSPIPTAAGLRQDQRRLEEPWRGSVAKPRSRQRGFRSQEGWPLAKLREGARRNQEGKAGAFARRADRNEPRHRPGRAAGDQRRKGRFDGPSGVGHDARRPRHHRAKVHRVGRCSERQATETERSATSSTPRFGTRTCTS